MGGDPLVTSVTKAVSGGATTTLTTTVNFLGRPSPTPTPTAVPPPPPTTRPAGLSTYTVRRGQPFGAARSPPTTTTAGWRPTTSTGPSRHPGLRRQQRPGGGNYANGTTLAYGYDTEGRLYSEAFDQAGGATLLSDSESLSQAGDVLTDAQAGPAGPLGSATYAYDSAGRLSSADGFGGPLLCLLARRGLWGT